MQHPRIHEAESKVERATKRGWRGNHNPSSDHRRKAYPRRPGGGAYQVDDDEHGDYDEWNEDEGTPPAYSVDYEDDCDDDELLEEVQILVTEHYGEGADILDLDDDEACALITVAQAKAKSKGKGKGNKGKRGGKATAASSKASDGQPTTQNFKASGTITLEQRKIKERQARIKVLKEKSKCNDCGEFGHWSGDAVCKKKKKFGASGYFVLGQEMSADNEALVVASDYRSLQDGIEKTKECAHEIGRAHV